MRYLDVPGGRVAYDDSGDGPLVLCAHGLGDTRAVFRLLAPRLVAAGHRVVNMDIRGYGDTSARWDDYSAAAVGEDMVALLRHLNAGPAVIIGESMAAGAAVWAAAEAPGLVAGLALTGPAVRPAPMNALIRLAVAALTRSTWLWSLYYKSLYPAARPADFDAYLTSLRTSLARPGRLAALRGTMASLHGRRAHECEQRLDSVQCPAIVLMGTKDSDFKDPPAEARWIGERLGAKVVLLDGGGHYPPAEFPDETMAQLRPFLAETLGGGRVA